MDTYRLMVIHWSIFTLSVQLVYCASVYSNIDSSLSPFSNSLCSPEIERFVRSEGRDSSLTFDLYPSPYTPSSCKRILTPPESHGFFIRLTRVPIAVTKPHNIGPSMISSRRLSSKSHNSTRSCPLTIFSLSDPLTNLWPMDPCQLESQTEDEEEPVKLLQGRLKIIWEHGGNTPPWKLVVTVIGKGLPCQQSNKHPCLKFGHEALLCISRDLICDGIRQCPDGSEYYSDEDEILCSNSKKDDDIWENFSMDVFRKFLTSETILPIPAPTTSSNVKNGFKPDDTGPKNTINKKGVDVEIRRNNTTRGTLTGDLSRYGPWGYLMLGMLLCGGALLMCGLWECCCRQNKPTNGTATTSTDTTNGNPDTNATITSTGTGPTDPAPPNYDDLDPPPSYSVLFPNQKAVSSTNATTNEANSSSDLSQTTNHNN